MTLLSVEQLSIGFSRYDGLVRKRELHILEGLSFGIERGEVLALIGASGAGKSLLAHAIFGILPDNAVTHGRLRFDGAILDQAQRAKLCGRRMALVPQSVSHLDPMTRCRKQIVWAGRRVGRRLDGADIAGLLSRYGLEEAAAEAYPHQLSGGMARRMMMAIASVGDPDLVVADEPTSGLDSRNAEGVLIHLRALADAGKAVLVITHSLAEALPFANRVAVMRGGRLDSIEPASGFVDDGDGLFSPYARALWRALPQNGFSRGQATC